MNPTILSSIPFLNFYPALLVKATRIGSFIIGTLGLIAGGLLGLIPKITLPLVDYSFSSLGLPAPDLFLALALIFLPIGMSMSFFEIFVAYYLKEPPLKGGGALERLDLVSAQIIYRAAKISGGPVTTNAILAAAAGHPDMLPLWLRLSVDQKILEKQLIETFGMTGTSAGLFSRAIELDPQAQAYIQQLEQVRQTHNSERITPADMLIGLFDANETFKNMMLQMNMDRSDLESLGAWYEAQEEHDRKISRFWELENLLRRAPIGTDWLYGYTPTLNRFAADISKKYEGGAKEIQLVGRKELTDEMEQVLARAGENNVLLVGEAGVGKRTVIEGLAQRVARGNALPALKYKRVLELNVNELTAAAKSPQEVLNLLLRIMKDASNAGNIILLIEDFHNFVGAQGAVGTVDISEVIKPYLASSNFQMVATTDPENFHRYIQSRADLLKLFEKMEVREPDTRQTLQILQAVLPVLESRQSVFVTYQALKNVVEKSDQFIQGVPFPEKAIDLLTEVVSSVKAQSRKLIMSQDVDQVISQKTNVQVGELAGGEKEKLENLGALIHQELVNQESAVKQLSDTMLRLRAGLSRKDKPAGAFLFTGPTGVGKTQTAKALAKVYFGSEDRMLRFDMSEYQTTDAIDRFIGNQLTREPGQFVSRVRDNPFSVILLDEFEKANRNILNLFLQVFDEGRLTDVFGKTISLRQNIIIATSNAGAEYIREMVAQGVDPASMKDALVNYLLENKLYSPELVNRFDEVVVFHPLNQEQIFQVARIMLDKLALRLKEQGHYFVPTEELVQYVGQMGFDPQFGARPMQRAIQNTVEVIIARKIINKEIQRGQQFSISPEELAAAAQ